MSTLSDEARAYFRDAAARRTRKPQLCAECGQPFEGLAWQRYCSTRCQNRETSRRYRARQRQAAAPPTPPVRAASPPAADPAPLASGDPVVLLRDVDDMHAGARGVIVGPLDAAAPVEVDFGSSPNHPRVRHVPRAWLQPAPQPVP